MKYLSQLVVEGHLPLSDGKIGWSGRTRTNAVVTNNEVSYQLDHAQLSHIIMRCNDLLDMGELKGTLTARFSFHLAPQLWLDAVPCHFHVHDVHEVHGCFDSIPLSPFVSAGLGFELLHSSQPLPKPSSRKTLS